MEYFKAFFRKWAARRSPPANQVILNHSTIYIIPSKQGLVFLFLILLIWILGTNYQNNIILGFAFLLLSLMMVSALHAFRNLLGLTFSIGSEKTAYEGEAVPFEIFIRSRYLTGHQSLFVYLDQSDYVIAQVEPNKTTSVVLHLFSARRGRCYLPRVTVKTYFPFGLMRAWAYVSLQQSAIIFPRPIESADSPLALGDSEEGGQLLARQGEEYYGFKQYVPGSSLSQIAWKQYARGAGLLIKDYRDYQAKSLWLDYSSLHSQDLEYKLSVLCYWVNRYSSLQQAFGLILPGHTIEVGEGDAHKMNALKALALYENGVSQDLTRKTEKISANKAQSTKKSQSNHAVVKG